MIVIGGIMVMIVKVIVCLNCGILFFFMIDSKI